MKSLTRPLLTRCAGALMFAAALIACNDDVAGLGPPSDPATEVFAPSLNVDIPSMTKLPVGVYVRDDVVGTGAEVVAASDTIWVDYAGYLKDGTLFDSGTNTKMIRGSGIVVGFNEGVVGMKVGGTRKIVIPSELGYGGVSKKDPATGKITIPRQSTIIFDVTLLKVNTPTTTPPVTLRAN
jgi:FKBP-type peptidyl-prolyl cis-trans isomerase FkpA